MTDGLADPRVKAGLDRQFAEQRELTSSRSTLLGWKVGFGAPAAMEKLRIAAPLTGFLLAENKLPSGAVCDLKGWVKPVLEPEIAVHLGRDLAAGCSEDEARTAIAGLGAAIEMADLSFAPEDPERILAENIYQRHVVLGAVDRTRAGARLDGLTGRLLINGSETASTTDLEANTGKIVTIVKQVADTLGAMRETLRAGQVIIAGSVVPPVFVQPEHAEIAFRLDPLETLSVRFTH
ncbi:MAG TPA: fumarylacetoacetate hydrolase family protein [Pseudolabrys sp.]|nr:fumarylacetoacetate hydrolase family protein [Pseudolabrys sp.]